jgi:hypothetical protein
LWDYPEIQRFLIPFLPLLAIALWLEGKWTVFELISFIRKSRSHIEKITGIVLGLAGGGLATVLIWNGFVDSNRAQLQHLDSERASLLTEKIETYDWIRQNSPADVRIVASEDACMYLYTGHQSMSFIALSRAAAYDGDRLQTDLDHMADVAQAIDAKYWVASIDDSDKEWKSAKPFMAARLNQIEAVLPELFRSSAGHVRVYDTHCIQHRTDRACQVADTVLFPAENATHNNLNGRP